MLKIFTEETYAGSRWFAAAGVLLVVAGMWALVWVTRRSRAQRRAGRVRPAESLTQAHPWLVGEEVSRAPRPRVQPVRHPEPPTQVLPRYDLDDATRVLYVVHPVDEPDATAILPRIGGGSRG